MKVIVDEKIPYIRGVIERLADEVVYLPGRSISRYDVKDADALIIRTRTHCDRELLCDSRVKFIATATIGFDHLDVDYLREAGIAWANCPGCNATSVAQYIHSSFLVLRELELLRPEEATVGIVGVGHVGTAVAEALRPFGCRLLLNDPPRAAKEGGDTFVSLEQVAAEADVVTFHTPLTMGGAYPTYHLADRRFLSSLMRQPILINSGRGEVVDNRALLEALDKHLVRQAVIDTWENEPFVSLPLLERVVIGTPHIAGYSADGKAHATQMALEAFCRFFDLKASFAIKPQSLPNDFVPAIDPDTLALQLYDPRSDSSRLKAEPDRFEMLRGNYPLRRERIG